jgi:hypothetical protein
MTQLINPGVARVVMTKNAPENTSAASIKCLSESALASLEMVVIYEMGAIIG